MPDTPPAGPGYTSFRLAGIDVIENGLPPLPDILTHDTTTPIPISYWAAPQSAVVAFFHFITIPEDGGVRPFVMNIPYYREAGTWTVETTGRISGLGFGFDPVTEPEFAADLDGSPFVYGSTRGVQSNGKPLLRTASGRASREVASIALVQAGVEDRHKLDSHFGHWTVCTQSPEPFEVVAYDSSGKRWHASLTHSGQPVIPVPRKCRRSRRVIFDLRGRAADMPEPSRMARLQKD